MKNGFIVFFLTVLLQEKELRATITQGPSNAVAENGDTVKLNCVADDVIGYWYLSKNGVITSEVILAGPGCSIRPAYVDHYAVEPLAGGHTCNLIVFNITMAQAGVYRCLEGTRDFLSILTVIDQTPTMESNTTLNVVAENQTVIDTCSLNHNGSVSPAPTLRPYFYWTDFNGQNVSSSYDSTTDNTAVSQLTVTAGRQNITSHTCHVYMQLNTSTDPKYANNIPTVNKNASSQTIEVLYSPGDINITSTISTTDNCVYQPENLTCSADANPPAECSWRDLSNNATTDDAVISITSGGQYQCTAHNKINSQTYTDTKVTTEATCHPTQNLTINGTNCENNFCTCNGNDSNSKQISIICMANGIPTPSVKWRSDNLFDGLDETIGVSLNGNYTCVALNTYGGKNYSEEQTVFVSGCEDSSPSSSTTSSTGGKAVQQSIPIGAIIGIVIGVIVIANIVAICLFFWYYKKVEVSHSGKKERINKLRLDRRFTWLKKMMPCVSETKESTGRSCLWVSLFILLGIVTGIVTFPIWILLAYKYEKNNETSALNTRENGDGNGSGENGRRPTNISSANHSQPPPTNQMNAIRQEGPYQNESSRENIELNNSLRSRNLLLPDSQPSRPPPAVRPPPPNKPMNLSTSRSKDYTVNDQQTQAANPEHTTYADLPFVPRNTLPTANPVQFLNVSNDTYASLNKT